MEQLAGEPVENVRLVTAHRGLALKVNHGILHEEVMALFSDVEALEYGQSKGAKVAHHDLGLEKGHSRIEQRIVKATDYLDWFDPTERKPLQNEVALARMAAQNQRKIIT